MWAWHGELRASATSTQGELATQGSRLRATATSIKGGWAWQGELCMASATSTEGGRSGRTSTLPDIARARVDAS